MRASLGRFDDSWDGTHYHLVLAALRAHILTFNDFEPIPNVVAFYHSYPRLLDTVRGYVWRFTGSILILQTFNLIAIAALVTFWRWRFGLSIRWTLVAILSVPLIQISATTLYVDTFANCFFAIAISALGVAFIDRRPLVRSEFIVSVGGTCCVRQRKAAIRRPRDDRAYHPVYLSATVLDATRQPGGPAVFSRASSNCLAAGPRHGHT